MPFFWIYKVRNFDYYNQISRNSMEDNAEASSDSLWGSAQSQFQCPCGKSYRSYPAIFTHIKNKHAGKAPGCIKKPHYSPKRRGRPPAHKKTSCSDTNVTSRSDPESVCFLETEIQTQATEEAKQIAKIIKILMSLPDEEVNRQRLNEITAILEMNVFLITKKREEESSLCIGWVVAKFLQELSKGVQWKRFQQMYTLLMLLVQFTIQSLCDPRVVSEGQIDLLFDHINAFVQTGLADMKNQHQISSLTIFEESVMLQLFHAFFQWLIARKYTNYRITINSDFINAPLI